MGYVRRSLLPDGYFHVWIRGVHGLSPFPEAEDRTVAFELFFATAARLDLQVEAACFLSTHYHAVVLARRTALSAALQRFHARYARLFNRDNARFGHVFAERFGCRTVAEDAVYDRCGYVLGNPVKARLCDHVRDWPWSYYRHGLDAFY